MAKKILALGDSWFHYPNGLDNDGRWVGNQNGVGNLIKYLVKDHNLPIYYRESTFSELYDAKEAPSVSSDDVFGRCGEELMVMVYGYRRKNPSKKIDNPTWLDLFIERISHYASPGQEFIILLSAGGNDIADDNLYDFLNNADNPAGALKNFEVGRSLNNINYDLKKAYNDLFNRICTRFPNNTFHFVVHGYAYPPVNGRTVFNLNGPMRFLNRLSPGPWLKPAFDCNHIIDRTQAELLIGQMIDTFNDMLFSLQSPQPNGHIHYADLRVVTDKLNRDKGWCNELHLDANSYSLAAQIVYELIKPIL